MRRALREATADEHARTEAAFTGVELADPRAYGAWLQAHARAFRAVGAAIAAQLDWPAWSARWADLAADLDQLGLDTPAPLALSPAASTAEAWGMAYVLEGSRLGSTLLLRQAPAGAPTAYLAGGLDREPWLRLQAAIEAANDDPAWRAAAVSGARAAFDAFRRGASLQFEPAA